MAKVFISSPVGTEDVARELSSALHHTGISTWLSADDLRLGNRIDEQLEKALDEADAYLVLETGQSSPSDLERQAVLKATFFYPDKKVVPVVLDAVKPSPLWRNWKALHVDRRRFDGADLAEQLKGILESLGDNRSTLSAEDGERRRERMAAIEKAARKAPESESSPQR